MISRLARVVLAAAAALAASGAASGAAGQPTPRDGQVVLMRHAAAPGTGDPPGFRLEDCATQRNLSDAGRDQARRIGAAVRQSGTAVREILSSRWCRALETARLGFGEPSPWPPLDSFFADRASRDAQTAPVRARISAWRGPGLLVMVTHQVNVTALTGVYPADGEILLLTPRPDGFEITGRIAIR